MDRLSRFQSDVVKRTSAMSHRRLVAVGRVVRGRLWEIACLGAVACALVAPGRASALQGAAVDGSLFLAADDGEHGAELWKATPGGAKLVKDIRVGRRGSEPHTFTRLRDRVYFLADDGVHGQELWRTNGTGKGTRLVANLTRGRNGALVGVAASRKKLFLSSTRFGRRGITSRLWTSDGTRIGTRMIRKFASKAYDLDIGLPAPLVRLGRYVLFYLDKYYDDDVKIELWTSDGTAGGTVRLARLGGTDAEDIDDLCDYDSAIVKTAGKGFFVGDVNGGRSGREWELWKTNGTPAGTRLVKDIYQDEWGCSGPSGLSPFEGRVYFAASDSVHGHELWSSDGTKAGTQLVSDINPSGDSRPGLPRPSVKAGRKLFFVADDGVRGQEVWTTNPANGTELVADVSVDYTGLISALGSTVFFTADDGIQGYELWGTRGTEASTSMVADLYPGPESSYPTSLGKIGVASVIFFRATDSEHGRELWVTDGTAGGTHLVRDIRPGPAGSYPSS